MEWRVNKLYGAAEEGLFRVEIPILAACADAFHTLCEAALTITAQVTVSLPQLTVERRKMSWLWLKNGREEILAGQKGIAVCDLLSNRRWLSPYIHTERGVNQTRDILRSHVGHVPYQANVSCLYYWFQKAKINLMKESV